jgi:hypothetical protein
MEGERLRTVAWNVQNISAHLHLLSYLYFAGKIERRRESETSTGRGTLAVAIENEELQYRTLTLSVFTARSSFKACFRFEWLVSRRSEGTRTMLICG